MPSWDSAKKSCELLAAPLSTMLTSLEGLHWSISPAVVSLTFRVKDSVRHLLAALLSSGAAAQIHLQLAAANDCLVNGCLHGRTMYLCSICDVTLDGALH